SVWTTDLLLRLLPSNLPLRFEIGIDGRVLAFTVAVTVFTGLAFGMAPALRGGRLDLAAALKNQGQGLAARRSRFAQSLIVGQMALCLVLLVAATLCLRSLNEARSFDPGFVVKDRLAVGLSLGDQGYSPAQTRELQDRLLARVETLPGVNGAAWTRYLPLGTERNNGRLQIEGRTPPEGEAGFFFEQFGVGPGYFATVGTRLLKGREFTSADRTGTRRVAVINEAAARRFWPGENPIGQRLFNGAPTPENTLEIVGVVATGSYRTLGEEPLPAIFDCFRSHPSAKLVAHVTGASGPAFAAIRNLVREMDSRLVLTDATTLEEHLSLVLFPARVSGLLLGVLGLVALILAVSGLFGVIAHAVSQRTREVGLRMALGAGRGDVQRVILRQGLTLAGIGIGLGLVGALATTRLLRHLLFGVSPTDPATFFGISVLLLAVAGLACWLPAWRASRLDPMAALRSE
ncbi:MAG TPA: ABC transporter permease, partial [Verrucomicrobiota bacterium]|nr:ABC transporter permease [Verrucomicrobiota bacterium]